MLWSNLAGLAWLLPLQPGLLCSPLGAVAIGGVPRIPLPRLFSVPDLVHVGGFFSPTLHGIPVSDLAGGYGSLAQQGMAHTLSRLSCVQVGASVGPVHTKAEEYCSPTWVGILPALAIVFSSGIFPEEFSKFP